MVVDTIMKTVMLKLDQAFLIKEKKHEHIKNNQNEIIDKMKEELNN
jgi:hypothetical protein